MYNSLYYIFTKDYNTDYSECALYLKDKNNRLKILNESKDKEIKYLNQEKIGKTESKRHMDFLQAETEFAHINNPWLRKHLARNKLKKHKNL